MAGTPPILIKFPSRAPYPTTTPHNRNVQYDLRSNIQNHHRKNPVAQGVLPNQSKKNDTASRSPLQYQFRELID